MGVLSSFIELFELFSNEPSHNKPYTRPMGEQGRSVFSSERTATLLSEQIKQLVKNGQKQEAVRLVQSRTGWNLHSSLRYVENIVTAIPSHGRHAHSGKARQTEIDQILEQQREAEDGGGRGIYDMFFSFFKKFR